MSESQPTIDAANLLQIIDHLTSAVILVDPNRRVILANRMTEMFSRKSKAQMQGLRGGEVIGCVNASCSPKGCGFSPQCELCTIKRKVEEAFENRSGSTFFELRMELNGLGSRDLRACVRYLRLNEADAVLISMEDITEALSKSQLEKQNAQLTAAIETAGAVCHELNQPMMVASGYIQLLLSDHAIEKLGSEQLIAINKEIERMTAITRKLMLINTYKTKNYAGISRILDIEESSKQSTGMDVPP